MHRDFTIDLPDHLQLAERRVAAAVLAAHCRAYHHMSRHLREAQAHIEEARRLTAENMQELEPDAQQRNPRPAVLSMGFCPRSVAIAMRDCRHEIQQMILDVMTGHDDDIIASADELRLAILKYVRAAGINAGEQNAD